MNNPALAQALAREANRQWEKCLSETTVPHSCPSDEEMATALLKIIEEFTKQQP